MAQNFPGDRAWVIASKAIRQCQIADEALQEGRQISASDHYRRALRYFSRARAYLSKADTRIQRRAGELLASGNEHLEKALVEYGEGYTHSGRAHYLDALRKYDAALDLID